MNLAQLMARQYDENTYHCVHFVVDAWRVLLDEDISADFSGMLTPLESASVMPLWPDLFVEIDNPQKPCIVVLRKGDRTPHMGMWYKGKILHLREEGPHYANLARICLEYDTVRFYTWRSSASRLTTSVVT